MNRLALALSLTILAAACGSEPEDSTNNAAANAEANNGKGDVIGTDDRRDEFSEDVTDDMRVLARSTAMIIERGALFEDGRDVLVTTQPLRDSYFMCPGEPFRDQDVAGMCTAWLVAPDVVVTNGHCVVSQSDCEQKSFIFDYAINVEGQDMTVVPNETVFHCETMLAWDNTNNCDIDYAVLKLDREVTNRPALKVRGPGEPIASENLLIIGHPFGLPRKYALEGNVINEWDNTFTTTHDIFGGNSGSAMFDVESGVVQGLVSCGGSNLNWEWIDEGWELETKTGQPCDASCDEEGLFVDGSWEETCGDDGNRRRCACDGQQLVWESRACLPFEDETGGQCTREVVSDQNTCETAPWLCATPVAQHPAHFAHFVGAWTKHGAEEPVLLEKGAVFEQEFVVEETGLIQAATMTFSFDQEFLDPDGNATSAGLALLDLNITITSPSGIIETISSEGEFFANTAYPVNNNPENTPDGIDVPSQLFTLEGEEAAGTWKLEITNKDLQQHQLKDWSLNLRVVPEEEFKLSTVPCIGETCSTAWDARPEPILETFEGEANEVTGDVEGEVAVGWEVEVWDPMGTGYEAFKTRRSQTISLQTGEMALVKDFGEDIGGRQVTLDYRYDGIGWFQVWADDQIIFAKQGFSAATETFPIPNNATKLSFVLGAVDDSQFHELSLFDVRIDLGSSDPMPAE